MDFLHSTLIVGSLGSASVSDPVSLNLVTNCRTDPMGATSPFENSPKNRIYIVFPLDETHSDLNFLLGITSSLAVDSRTTLQLITSAHNMKVVLYKICLLPVSAIIASCSA
jgi:hypothetical protein